MTASIGGCSRIKRLGLFSQKQLSPRRRTKTHPTIPLAMEVFSAEQRTRYPVSSLQRPIPEAQASTIQRL